MANENIPAPAAPSSTSPAKPISLASLNQELAKRPSPQPPPAAQPPPQRVAPVEVKSQPVEAPAPKTETPPTAVPNYKEALRERMAKKAEPEAKPEKKSDPKPETKPETKPDPVVEAKPEAAAPAEEPAVPEDQKRVLPHDKPDTAKRIKALLAERDAAREEAQKAKAEYEAAKKAPQTPPEELAKLKADHEAAQADLMRYRRRYEIENDKEFAAKYREPVKKVEESIETTLKKAGFTDSTIEIVRKEGGFAAFSRSNKTFTVQEPDPDNEGKTRPVQRTAAQIARAWLDTNIPVSDSEFIRAAVGKQQLLQSEEQAAIQQAQDEAKTYFETQTKAQREAAEKQAEATRKATEEYEKWAAETESKTDWLKDRTIPDNATPEQRKEIEDYNEFNKQLRSSLKKHPSSALEYGQLKLEAAEAHHLRRTLGQKDAEIAALRAKLESTKGALRTTPKGGSILKSNPTEAPKDVSTGDPMKDFKNGLRARLQRASGSALDE